LSNETNIKLTYLRYDKNQTVRVPHKNEQGLVEQGNVDLAVQRQAASSAILIWQMLNPDEKSKPLGNTGNLEILINEERSWNSFANDRNWSDNIDGHTYSTVSLESFHDGIHTLLGTASGPGDRNFKGHMGNPAFAAVSIIVL
jgi:hypothetical protein